MIDGFGRKINYLRLSVTELCDLRCRYCMPEDGICKKPHKDVLTEEETIMAVTAAASLGISKVRITGGEPLVKKNILSICEKTASTQGIDEVCMTTNGILLPKFAADLKNAGIRRVNLSFDTLDEKKYAYITRTGQLKAALRGLDHALSAGFEKVKINVVLIGGFNDDEIPALAGLTRKYPVDVRFIELMPMYEGNGFDTSAYIPCSTVTDVLEDLVPAAHDGGVARLYKLPGAMGNIGLISPISDHFCAACNRIRLTADGHIKPCLHSRDEFCVKGLSYEDMTEQFRRAIMSKPEMHCELSSQSASRAGRSMNKIGG
ncbi:MAG: GTP 3',8-cyclase MoaA [Oscillospiraceae bacterium]|nr:GTP 3',8-cyclase MoaA [Oscillospiraceae bacterium]